MTNTQKAIELLEKNQQILEKWFVDDEGKNRLPNCSSERQRHCKLEVNNDRALSLLQQPTCFPSVGEFVKETKKMFFATGQSGGVSITAIIDRLEKACDLLTAPSKTIAELKLARVFVCVACGKIDPSFIVECQECKNKRIDTLIAENAEQAEQIKLQRKIIQIDVSMFDDIKGQYSKCKDLVAKVEWRDQKVDQALGKKGE